MKQRSILGYFSRTTTIKEVSIVGDTIIVNKENSGKATTSDSQPPTNVERNPKNKPLKRKLEDFFPDDGNVENEDQNSSQKEDDDDMREITDVTNLCEVPFKISDDIYLSSQVLEQDAPEKIFLRNDYSLIYFMIRKVFFEHGHLFTPDDRSHIEKFLSLSLDEKIFFIKVFKRKRNWQSFEKNSPDKEHILRLTKADFFELSAEHHFDKIEEIFNLLKVKEVVSACKKLNISASNKKDMLKAILKANATQTTLTISPKKLDQTQITLNYFQKLVAKKFFRINSKIEFVFHKILLLFYNPYACMGNYVDTQNYSAPFRVVNDNFLNTPYQPKVKIYETSCEFDDFVVTFLKVQDFKVLINSNKSALVENYSVDELKTKIWDIFLKYCFQLEIDYMRDLPIHLYRFTTSAILFSALSDIFINAKSSSYIINGVLGFQDASLILQRLLSDTRNSRNHRASLQLRYLRMLNQHENDLTESMREFLQTILNDPKITIAGLYDILNMKVCQKILPSIKTQYDEYFTKNFLEVTISAKYRSAELQGGNRNSFYFEKDGQEHYASVEDICRMHYCDTEGFTKSMHCEGSVYLALFHSFCRDIVHSTDIPDVFRYYRQELPLDMKYSEEFVRSRSSMIQAKISKIANMEPDEYSNFVFVSLEGGITPSKQLQVGDLIEISLCFGPIRMSKICNILLNDYLDYKKGLPDLLLWKPGTDQIKMIEVKGHKDSLSGNQILWLNRLVEFGFDAICCHVAPST